MKINFKKSITILATILVMLSAVYVSSAYASSNETVDIAELEKYFSKPIDAKLDINTKYVLKYNNEEKKYDIYVMGTGRKVDMTGWVYVHDPDTPSDNWYYFDKNTKNIKTGWIEDEGNVYYLHEKKDSLCGRVYSGWHDIKDVVYFFNEHNFALEKVMSKQDARKNNIETIEGKLQRMQEEAKALQAASEYRNNTSSNYQSQNSAQNITRNDVGQPITSSVGGASNPADAMRQAEANAQNGAQGLTGEELVRILNQRNSQIR